MRWSAIVETSNPQYSDKETERSRIFGVASVLYGSVHISGKEARIVWSTAQQVGQGGWLCPIWHSENV